MPVICAWPELPLRKGTLEVSVIIALPTAPDSGVKSAHIQKFVGELDEVIHGAYGDAYEVLIVPFGTARDEPASVGTDLADFIAAHSRARIETGQAVRTRALAVRHGFLRSVGARLVVMQVDQPCGSSFFKSALEFMDFGYAMVRANRRLPQTVFRTPVRLLPFMYTRHQLAFAFNSVVRWLFPLHTTDTQYGTFVISRPLAFDIFALQHFTNFIFDLERNLISRSAGARELDLPVQLQIIEEKSRQTLLRETIAIAWGLPSLWVRYRRGFYRPFALAHAISADDWGLSPGVNEAMLELLRAGIVKRVALLADSDYLTTGLAELKKLPAIEIGLHFNLTFGDRQSFGPGSPLKFLLRWLNPFARRRELVAQVRDELRRQLGILNAHGIRPVYMDGHHHIHVVPGLLNAVADILKDHGIAQVRLPFDPAIFFSTKAPINFLALLARSALRKHGFKSLPCFYPQARHFADQGFLRARLAENPGAEVIVHPSTRNDVSELGVADPYSAERVTEYRALRMLKS